MAEGLWNEFIEKEKQKPYFKELWSFVVSEYKTKEVYPPYDLIFNAYHQTPCENIKVVILGQDPYHQKHQAMGLAFSVSDKTKIPPSLVNIYKELNTELNIPIKNNGDLTNWAKQGVFLLNTTLTVLDSKPMSHADKGWEQFTDDTISFIEQIDKPIVYMLWGSHAQKKVSLIHNPKHKIIKCAHPSPLSAYRGFFGSNCFKECNEFLINNNVEPIDWSK